MTGSRAQGLTIRAALVLGFGLTLGLWIFTGYDITARMSQVQSDSSSITARYMRAQELLSTVRAQALLSSVYVRDALLDPDPLQTDGYRLRLEESYTAMAAALSQYVPVVDSPIEQQRVAAFRRELADFRSTIHEVLATDRTRWPLDARHLLNERVMPKRANVIALSEDVQALNRRAYVEQQASIARIHAVAERQTWQRLGLALVASLGIGLLATVYASRLEVRIRRQHDRDVRNTRDLQRLSAQLVTAQEAERRTIARELHDEVGQVLTAVKVELSLAQRSLESTGVNGRMLDTAQTIADSALHTVRDLSRLLHPSVLDDLGLLTALDAHVQNFSRRHGIRVELLHEHMDERLAPELEIAAYRIVQEALTNVARHAGASMCRVFVQRLPHTVLITVEDRGQGFDADANADAARGLGLISIRERATQLQGTVRIESTPGTGTRITVELPARARPADVETPAIAAAEVIPAAGVHHA